MRSFLRKTLRNILGYLSIRTIKKHSAEVILISGWAGSSIVREMTYHMLSEDFHLRRNVSGIWWDLSVPLNILGYEDKRRSILGWSILILRAFLSLLFKQSYQHKIILNLDTSIEDIAEFWSKYVNPHILVILREKPNSKLIKILRKREGREKILYVYNPEFFKGFGKKTIREFKYAKGNADLVYKKKAGALEIIYKKEKIEVRIPKAYKFIQEFIPAAFSIGILEGISIENLARNFSSFEFHPKQLQRGISKLKRFVHTHE
ncbi:hypothetical protein JW766_03415 [Candidatus Dojkabacteria bacterium]|nr:hypothetical protein [Candidatus Dojkabacteria bacterium]